MVLEETEQETFRALFETHKDKIYSIALRYSGDPNTAQDIAQDVFLKLFSSLGTFRGESNFESWLYRLVVNACFDHRRRNRRLVAVFESFFDSLKTPNDSVLDKIVRTESGDGVRAAIAKLPPEQRMIVVLRYTKGLTYEDIAAVLGCSTGTVASRLSRAHKALARRLK